MVFKVKHVHNKNLWPHEFLNLVLDIRCHSIESAKFIAGKQWFAAGDDCGSIHVYAYTTKEKVKEIKVEDDGESSVYQLAVHPTESLLLTGSKSTIKLWDWDQGWTCTREFNLLGNNIYLLHLEFGPSGTNTFASATNSSLKVWDIQSTGIIATLPPSWGHTFYTNSHGHFLVTIGDCGDAK
ncbi:unnamed protein product, partial [Urochloa humidicola]